MVHTYLWSFQGVCGLKTGLRHFEWKCFLFFHASRMSTTWKNSIPQVVPDHGETRSFSFPLPLSSFLPLSVLCLSSFFSSFPFPRPRCFPFPHFSSPQSLLGCNPNNAPPLSRCNWGFTGASGFDPTATWEDLPVGQPLGLYRWRNKSSGQLVIRILWLFGCSITVW